MKRKFDLESDDSVPTLYQNAKQLKLIPFPNCEPDNDSAMSEAEPFDLQSHHTRIPSNVSSTSSSTSDSPTLISPSYPAFDIYPLPFFDSEGSVDPNSHTFSNYAAQSPTSQSVGLLQPSSSFSHHGTSCSQIPKLRVACAAGRNGQRTMWSFCEQCGAISMVDND